jgi:hypothetical protein
LKPVFRRGGKEIQEMKRKKPWEALLLSALVLIPLFIFIEKVQPDVEHPKLPKVVFYVSWYDVGEAVLEGLKGVELVNNGFHDSKETNTVWYDPALISIAQMEKALKDAGTYLGIAK